jgi:hypothetical protein
LHPNTKKKWYIIQQKPKAVKKKEQKQRRIKIEEKEKEIPEKKSLEKL